MERVQRILRPWFTAQNSRRREGGPWGRRRLSFVGRKAPLRRRGRVRKRLRSLRVESLDRLFSPMRSWSSAPLALCAEASIWRGKILPCARGLSSLRRQVSLAVHVGRMDGLGRLRLALPTGNQLPPRPPLFFPRRAAETKRLEHAGARGVRASAPGRDFQSGDFSVSIGFARGPRLPRERRLDRNAELRPPWFRL